MPSEHSWDVPAKNLKSHNGKQSTFTATELVADGMAPAISFQSAPLHEGRPMRFEPSRLAFVWIALQGGPMGRAAVYQRVCIATEQELGVRINPHAFRAIVATGSPCRRM